MASGIDDDDRALFQKAVGRVRPVKSDRIAVKKNNKPKAVRKKRSVDIEDSTRRFPHVHGEILSVADSVRYKAPGIQNKVLKNLKRGFFEIEAQLDLHGLTAVEAKRRLVSFLHQCSIHDVRCALIIHGKGYRSPDQQPVLKNKLNYWLREHGDVLAFCSAPRAYGGTGALLVLIRPQ